MLVRSQGFLTFFCTLVSGKHLLIYDRRRYALLFDECVIFGFGLVIPFLGSLFGIYHLPSPGRTVVRFVESHRHLTPFNYLLHSSKLYVVLFQQHKLNTPPHDVHVSAFAVSLLRAFLGLYSVVQSSAQSWAVRLGTNKSLASIYCICWVRCSIQVSGMNAMVGSCTVV